MLLPECILNAKTNLEIYFLSNFKTLFSAFLTVMAHRRFRHMFFDHCLEIIKIRG